MSRVDAVQRQIGRLGSDLGRLLANVKQQYHKLDPETRKKVAAGIAGLGLVLAATARHRHKKRKKARQES